jgi:GTPase SAR1 family protein
MKLVLTGSHGTGKTTLLKALKEKLPDYDIQIESLTRKAVSGADKLNMGTTDESERLVAKLYMESFLSSPKNFIASRHMIDVLAYSMYLKKKNNNIKDDTLCDLENRIEEIKEKKIFDMVFYLPIEFNLSEEELNKEFREGQKDINYRRDVDTIIKFLLWAYEIPYMEIVGSVEERVNKILHYMKLAKAI